MKQILPLMSAWLLAGTLSAQVSIAPDGNYSQNFSGLGSASSTWVDNTTLLGWYASISNAPTGAVGPYTTAYTASAGGSTSSTTLYALGSSGSSERALGGFPNTENFGLLGWRLVNSSDTLIDGLTLTYDGEQWRRDTTVNSHINVSYKIFASGTGGLDSLENWTAAPASLTFTPPTTGTGGAISGNDDANRAAGLTAVFTDLNLQPNDEIWFKWTLYKISGGNIVMGIDNVAVDNIVTVVPEPGMLALLLLGALGLACGRRHSNV
jgi:hypothetical protein